MIGIIASSVCIEAHEKWGILLWTLKQYCKQMLIHTAVNIIMDTDIKVQSLWSIEICYHFLHKT